jgi:hypothetical protein
MWNVGIGGKGRSPSGLESVGRADPAGERHVNTDRLIDLLSANLEPVNQARLGKTLVLAILAGGAGAAILMLGTVGPRPDLQTTAHLEWTALKLVLPLSVIALGAPFLVHSMRPGLASRTNWPLLFFPFVLAIAVSLAIFFIVRPEVWIEMLLGSAQISSPRCFFCILSFAALPFVALIWALRQGAPTRLGVSGALAGIVAGGVGAVAYAFNCNSDTIPFITIWYSAAIALCGLIGGELGPHLLQW